MEVGDVMDLTKYGFEVAARAPAVESKINAQSLISALKSAGFKASLDTGLRVEVYEEGQKEEYIKVRAGKQTVLITVISKANDKVIVSFTRGFMQTYNNTEYAKCSSDLIKGLELAQACPDCLNVGPLRFDITGNSLQYRSRSRQHGIDITINVNYEPSESKFTLNYWGAGYDKYVSFKDLKNFSKQLTDACKSAVKEELRILNKANSDIVSKIDYLTKALA
jgi:hypothetical protein